MHSPTDAEIRRLVERNFLPTAAARLPPSGCYDRNSFTNGSSHATNS
jgi:hypothetical protein